MKAIILAGGFGTRLRPMIGDNIPKCLAPVMGRPMLDLILRNMRKQGISDITLALHYKAQMFIDAFGSSLKYKVEDEPLGTGGAIKNCIWGVQPTLVCNGDTVTHVDYQDMMNQHTSPLTVAVTQRNGHMQNAGIYIINPSLFDNFPQKKFSFEFDVLPKVLKKFYVIKWFTDLGTPEAYASIPKDWI